MLLPLPLAALVVPFLVAAGAAGLLRPPRPGKGRAFGAGAIALGVLAAFVALAGGLPFFESVPHHRAGELFVVLTLAGFALPLLGEGIVRSRAMALWGGLAVVAWEFGLDRPDALGSDDLILAVPAVVATILVMIRLPVLADAGGAPVGIAGVASLGLAAVAELARSGIGAGLALALAAACLGWLVWARPLARVPGAAPGLVASAALVGLAVEIERNSLHAPWAMPVLVACFWPERFLALMPFLARPGRRKGTRPVMLILAAAPPAALAAGLALLDTLLRAPA